MWMGYLDTRQRDPATRQLFEDSQARSWRIEDPWRQGFLLAQALICYAGFEALMGRDESAEAMVAKCEAQSARIGKEKLYIGHGLALLGTIAVRRGQFNRAHDLLVESLAMYRAVESNFDITGSLAQQGFLALLQRTGAGAGLFSSKSADVPQLPDFTWGDTRLGQVAYRLRRLWPAACGGAPCWRLGGSTLRRLSFRALSSKPTKNHWSKCNAH